MKKDYYLLVLSFLFIISSNIHAASHKVYADKLEKCQAFEFKFRHPFTGGMMKKKIIGLNKAGRCVTYEQMPNNGRMDCKYTTVQRKAIAKYLRQIEGKNIRFKFNISIKTNMKTTTGNMKTSERVAGKKITNPGNEALKDGTCVISGY